MRAQIIRIGNSQGLRIPKVLLEDAKISGDVELEVCSEGILIRNISKPRSGWDDAFKKLSDADDDAVPVGATSAFDEKEWHW
jgi:antitoxin MazE